jgi:Protein of unknown function (DUF3102)
MKNSKATKSKRQRAVRPPSRAKSKAKQQKRAAAAPPKKRRKGAKSKPKTKKAKASADDSADNAATIKRLLEQIRVMHLEIERDDGRVLRKKIEVGKKLRELRQLITSKWQKHLKSIGVSPRSASRYMRISDELGHMVADLDDGGDVPELLHRMPDDVQKLETLCRLSPRKLDALSKTLDFKAATRGMLIQAVNEKLGKKVSGKVKDDSEMSAKDIVCHFMQRAMFLRDLLDEGAKPTELRTELVKAAKEHRDWLTKTLVFVLTSIGASVQIDEPEPPSDVADGDASCRLEAVTCTTSRPSRAASNNGAKVVRRQARAPTGRRAAKRNSNRRTLRQNSTH